MRPQPSVCNPVPASEAGFFMGSAMNRRSLLTGFGALLAAPAFVRAEALMPLRGIVMPVETAHRVWVTFTSPLTIFHPADGTQERPYQTIQQALAHVERLDLSGREAVINLAGVSP